MNEYNKGVRRRRIAWIWGGIALFATILWGVWALKMIWEAKGLRDTLHEQKEQLNRNNEVIQSLRASTMVFLMSETMEAIEKEVVQHPERKLSESSIAKLVDLAGSFIPYRSMSDDSLANEAFSPERGMLLQALLRLEVHPDSWGQILEQACFARADLQYAQLEGAPLPGIQLEGANLRDAMLKGADLRGAMLEGVHASHSYLDSADLSGANLSYADLGWSSCRSTRFDSAQLFGVKLHSADVRMASMQGVYMRWSICHGALFQGASLLDSDVYGSSFRRANLSEVIARNANMAKTDLSFAVIEGSDLRQANLLHASLADPSWIDGLKPNKVLGADHIQERYHLEKDLSKRSDFRLEAEGGQSE